MKNWRLGQWRWKGRRGERGRTWGAPSNVYYETKLVDRDRGGHITGPDWNGEIGGSVRTACGRRRFEEVEKRFDELIGLLLVLLHPRNLLAQLGDFRVDVPDILRLMARSR